ncbi:MAG: Stp1/IreP family PP2C-type Ser/Thr phosphatase [Caldiserica bacterium]|jgi:protein phosphatase|nr:Stp1/IreP family PP2C-type Ser/Thr phosphatase [Caldisericota bacterium]MDH7562604.1 Stp1/IreP family PP2C-type Ser/Thr phosphatase [Caldisericota bacterium]
MKFKAWGVTDKGYYRSNNEDAIHLSHEEGDLNLFPFFIVADGLGGHAFGEVASRLAVERASEILFKSGSPDHEVLKSAFREAHQGILKAKEENPDYQEMGTTMTALWLKENYALVGNCGDSRAYLFRNSHLLQISKDHSYVQELIDRRLITAREARFHPYRNIVTGVLGLEGSFRTDVFPVETREGDLFLLTTDGLTEELSDEEIEKIIATHPPENLIYELLSQALDRGGQDNISFIVVNLLTDQFPS